MGYDGVVRRRLPFAIAALTLLALLAMLVWQGSFSFSFAPRDVRETIVLWAVSTTIFLLTVTLGFMLIRAWVKTYIDRQKNKEGSRIRSKLLIGALALTVAPTLFSALFNYTVLNRTLDKWFTQPARGLDMNLHQLDEGYQKETQQRIQAETQWISLLPQTLDAARTGHVDTDFFRDICGRRGIPELVLARPDGGPLVLYRAPGISPDTPLQRAQASVSDGGENLGQLTASSPISRDIADAEDAIARYTAQQQQLAGRKKFYQDTEFLLICLITLFVLFFAAWSAQILARQISIPISALLGAAEEVRHGNLSYRVRVNAIDELATLVRAFNEMTRDLEASTRELESRRRFTEAILESIPSGVMSVSSDERIERVNRAFAAIFPKVPGARVERLQDLFSPEDLAEIRYVLKRARRTGAAACQLEIQRTSSVLHLAVTVASVEAQRGFVIVFEDISDLLRAQKTTAWQEVARRIAHEIKNPLTPIALCADRISRHVHRNPLDLNARAVLQECAQTIQQEVQTLKSLVDEFSQFSRFPAAQPVPADLNEIIESAMSVFSGRLGNISLTLDLDRTLPLVLADKEQIKRVIINLVDNAAEAMTDAPVRNLLVATARSSSETVELSITDTGCGVDAAAKEKLFLPYFSTKERGTGLGLAIVRHIVAEHHGTVRVEDNYPAGTRFTVDLNALPSLDSAEPPAVRTTPVAV